MRSRHISSLVLLVLCLLSAWAGDGLPAQADPATDPKAWLADVARGQDRKQLPAVVPFLTNPDAAVAAAAVTTISRLSPLDEATMQALRQAAASAPADLRSLMLRSLVAAQDLKAIPILIGLLRDEQAGPEAHGLLLQLTQGQDFGSDRPSWMAWMRQVEDGERGFLQRSRETFGGEDPKALAAAIAELGGFRALRPEAIAIVEPFAAATDEEVQGAAKAALARLRPQIQAIQPPATPETYVFHPMHAVFAVLGLLILAGAVIMIIPSWRSGSVQTARTTVAAVKIGTERIQQRVTLVMTTRRFKKKK